jgi:hypothetical protein
MPKLGAWLWDFATDNMSRAAAAFQKLATGAPVGKGYYVKGVQFDGYKSGTLIEAKGFESEGRFLRDLYYQMRKGYELLGQARKQLDVAGSTPIEWRFKDRASAELVATMFRRYDLNIKVTVWAPSTGTFQPITVGNVSTNRASRA